MIVDTIIVGFVGFAVWRGWRRGLLNALTSFVGFIVGAIAAVLGFGLLAGPLKSLGISAGIANIVGAVVIFLGVSLLFGWGGRALTKVVRITFWGKLNDAGGAALSGFWALSWVTVVLLAISVIPAPASLEKSVGNSTIASGIVREAPAFTRSLARTDMRDMLALFARRDRGVSINATTDYRLEPHEERLLIYLVNKERRARRLPALRFDAALQKAARAHVSDMYRRGYFGHNTPEGLTPGARLRRAKVSYRYTGENIALAPSLQVGHNELMTSSRHRSHVLSGRFTRIGVGVVFGPQGLLIAEEFAG